MFWASSVEDLLPLEVPESLRADGCEAQCLNLETQRSEALRFDHYGV